MCTLLRLLSKVLMNLMSSLFHFSSLQNKRIMPNKQLFCSFFPPDIIYKNCNISVRFHSRKTILDIFEIYMSLAVRKTTKTLLKTCLKLRNKLKSKCVQFFDTPCSKMCLPKCLIGKMCLLAWLPATRF